MNILLAGLALFLAVNGAGAVEADGQILDTLSFGRVDSEKAHGLTAQASTVVAGALGRQTRTFQALAAGSWEGGSVEFTMKVDGTRENYFTAQLWGSDRSTNRLILYCEGKQIGYRHLGDIDVLDAPNGRAAYPGRFYYQTCPLPLALTKGKTELHCEIRATGSVYGYASEFDKYQKAMAGDSRGLYDVYTHVEGCFVPPEDGALGEAPVNAPLRMGPGEEVLGQVKERVNREIDKMMRDGRAPNQHEMWFLARAYHVGWTSAAGKAEVVKKIVDGLDGLYVAYRQKPDLALNGPDIYNNEWFGVGPAACAVVLLAEPLGPYLDGEIAGAPGVTRRAGLAEMFAACRDLHRINRRQYTNQTIIIDTYGIYLPNRAVEMLEPKEALTEEAARHYLYEAVALAPWRGSDKTLPGLEKAPRTDWQMGDNYLQLTKKGLTKELGYVGYYGEVLDWMTAVYEATEPAPGQPGDERLKAQLVKVAHARAVFREPGLDEEGNRAMLGETVIGWRDEDHYPGDVIYGQRPTWDSSGLGAAAATRDPALIGYVQEMFGDGQFFSGVAESLKGGSLRVTAGLLDVPDDYAALKAAPAEGARLPMAQGQPDFVFADEEDGVVVVKNGGETLYVSLYWRARCAINFLARVHYTVPGCDRIAVVREEEQFDPSGLVYTRPDWTNFGFGNGGPRYPGEFHSALAGEKLPIAKIPAGIAFKPGDENPYAGRASFYELRYGKYLIGINASGDKTYEVKVPGDARELVSKRTGIAAGTVEKVGPGTTVVYYLGR